MHVTSLRVFVDRLSEAQRLGFGDLRRLQRDVLPNGPERRDNVEVLLALDMALERADRGWPEYLLETVKTFVLGSADPPGVVGPEFAGWVISALSEIQPKTAQRIARAVSEAVKRSGPPFHRKAGGNAPLREDLAVDGLGGSLYRRVAGYTRARSRAPSHGSISASSPYANSRGPRARAIAARRC
jgi:hypothetical protein